MFFRKLLYSRDVILPNNISHTKFKQMCDEMMITYDEYPKRKYTIYAELESDIIYIVSVLLLK